MCLDSHQNCPHNHLESHNAIAVECIDHYHNGSHLLKK